MSELKLEQKLDHFTATILAEATAETERALAELEEKRNIAYAAAKSKIRAEIQHYMRTEVSRIKAEAGHRISRRMLEDKQELYLRRNQIAQEVFSAVREKLTAYTESDAYQERLAALVRKASEALKGASDLCIYLRRADLPRAQALAACLNGAPVRFAEGSFQLGGLIADSPSEGRMLDCSFDSAVAALDGHFVELFGLVLSDEMAQQ
ncbi:MAG: hypothetical protein EOM69_04475 [Clostridia bacterium]|nr:hypothetical protein [Clostridia bacterium]